MIGEKPKVGWLVSAIPFKSAPLQNAAARTIKIDLVCNEQVSEIYGPKEPADLSSVYPSPMVIES